MSQRTSSVASPRQPANGPVALPVAQHLDAVSEDVIAKRAYEKFIARGCTHGFDQQDWAAAEQELTAEALDNNGSNSRKNEAQTTRLLK